MQAMQTGRYADRKDQSIFLLRCRAFMATIEVPQKKNGEISKSCAPICSKAVGAGAGLGGGPARKQMSVYGQLCTCSVEPGLGN